MLKTGVYQQACPVLFGSGVSAKTGDIAKDLNFTKVLLITDKSIAGIGHDKIIIKSLEEKGISVVEWTDVVGDCPDSSVRQAAKFAIENKVDGIVGLGGGSSLDTAKAVAVVVENSEEILEDIPSYIMGIKKYEKAPMKLILVPTTAGTGAEITFVCVVSSSKIDSKIGLPCAATYAIVDPQLAVGTPAHITAYSGMDAFSHAVEALGVGNATMHSDLLAYEAISLITKWLPKSYADIMDEESRSYLAYASNLAGIAISLAGVHMGHSVAHNLGHIYHIPHGVGCGIMTPPVIELMANTQLEKVKKIGLAMGMSDEELQAENLGENVAENVRNLMRTLNFPTLKDKGLTQQQMLELAELSIGEGLCMSFEGGVTKEDLVKAATSAYEKL